MPRSWLLRAVGHTSHGATRPQARPAPPTVSRFKLANRVGLTPEVDGSAARGTRDVAIEDGLALVAAGGADRLVGECAHVVGEDVGDGVGAVHARAFLDVLLELGDDNEDVVVDDVVEVHARGRRLADDAPRSAGCGART